MARVTDEDGELSMGLPGGIMHMLRGSYEGFSPWFDAYRVATMKKPRDCGKEAVAQFESEAPKFGAAHARLRKAEAFAGSATFAGAGTLFAMGTFYTANPIVGAACGALGGAAGFAFGSVMGKAANDLSFKEAHSARAHFYVWQRLRETKQAAGIQ